MKYYLLVLDKERKYVEHQEFNYDSDDEFYENISKDAQSVHIKDNDIHYFAFMREDKILLHPKGLFVVKDVSNWRNK